jgi:hypothetical protein
MTGLAKTIFIIALFSVSAGTVRADRWDTAARNAGQAREAFVRSRDCMHGWLARLDPVTGLLPRRGDHSTWYVRDTAADLYPFMIMAAFYTEPDIYRGAMMDILRQEILLANRVDRLPDNVLAGGGFEHEDIDMGRIIFGASEYVKDGLLPLTELLGHTPWYYRMVGIVDDIIKHAPYETEYGRLPSLTTEINGEMLQNLSRLYYLTRNGRYLEQATAIADFYTEEVLPKSNYLPPHAWDLEAGKPGARFFHLSGHGNGIAGGMGELIIMLRETGNEHWRKYVKSYRRMIDNVLEHGRNPDGIWYRSLDINTLEPDTSNTSNCWGYLYNAVYSAYLITGEERYRDEIAGTMAAVAINPSYLFDEANKHKWTWIDETGIEVSALADAYSDALESSITFLNRIPNPAFSKAMDNAFDIYWTYQRPDGIVEDWYGDGNYIRTALMYALMKTGGTHAEPWNQYLRLGAVMESDGGLNIFLSTPVAWSGRLVFDHPRHRDHFNMPLNYPRLNEFPEWFTADYDRVYEIKFGTDGEVRRVIGANLIDGLPITLSAGEILKIEVRETE